MPISCNLESDFSLESRALIMIEDSVLGTPPGCPGAGRGCLCGMADAPPPTGCGGSWSGAEAEAGLI